MKRIQKVILALSLVVVGAAQATWYNPMTWGWVQSAKTKAGEYYTKAAETVSSFTEAVDRETTTRLGKADRPFRLTMLASSAVGLGYGLYKRNKLMMLLGVPVVLKAAGFAKDCAGKFVARFKKSEASPSVTPDASSSSNASNATGNGTSN